jgi:hypothetical protein
VDGNTLVQLAGDIEGKRVGDRSGYTVSLSSDGSDVADGWKNESRYYRLPLTGVK